MGAGEDLGGHVFAPAGEPAANPVQALPDADALACSGDTSVGEFNTTVEIAAWLQKDNQNAEKAFKHTQRQQGLGDEEEEETESSGEEDGDVEEVEYQTRRLVLGLAARAVAVSAINSRMRTPKPRSCLFFSWEHPLRQRALWLVHKPAFANTILVLIVFNSVTLALDSPDLKGEQELQDFLHYSEIVFVICFAVEMALKVFALSLWGHDEAYLSSGWNVLDGVIVIIGLTNLLLPVFTGESAAANISAIRLLRVLRPLRTVSRIKGMRVLIKTLVGSLSSLADVFLLLTFLLTIFAIAGIQLWSESLHQRCYWLAPDPNASNGTSWALDPNDTEGCSHEITGRRCESNISVCAVHDELFHVQYLNFDHMATAMFTVFKAITLDDWPEDLWLVMNTHMHIAWIVYFILVLCGAYFAVNLFLAVLSKSFADSELQEDASQTQTGVKMNAVLNLMKAGTGRQEQPAQPVTLQVRRLSTTVDQYFQVGERILVYTLADDALDFSSTLPGAPGTVVSSAAQGGAWEEAEVAAVHVVQGEVAYTIRFPDGELWDGVPAGDVRPLGPAPARAGTAPHLTLFTPSDHRDDEDGSSARLGGTQKSAHPEGALSDGRRGSAGDLLLVSSRTDAKRQRPHSSSGFQPYSVVLRDNGVLFTSGMHRSSSFCPARRGSLERSGGSELREPPWAAAPGAPGRRRRSMSHNGPSPRTPSRVERTSSCGAPAAAAARAALGAGAASLQPPPGPLQHLDAPRHSPLPQPMRRTNCVRGLRPSRLHGVETVDSDSGEDALGARERSIETLEAPEGFDAVCNGSVSLRIPSPAAAAHPLQWSESNIAKDSLESKHLRGAAALSRPPKAEVPPAGGTGEMTEADTSWGPAEFSFGPLGSAAPSQQSMAGYPFASGNSFHNGGAHNTGGGAHNTGGGAHNTGTAADAAAIAAAIEMRSDTARGSSFAGSALPLPQRVNSAMTRRRRRQPPPPTAAVPLASPNVASFPSPPSAHAPLVAPHDTSPYGHEREWSLAEQPSTDGDRSPAPRRSVSAHDGTRLSGGTRGRTPSFLVRAPRAAGAPPPAIIISPESTAPPNTLSGPTRVLSFRSTLSGTAPAPTADGTCKLGATRRKRRGQKAPVRPPLTATERAALYVSLFAHDSPAQRLGGALVRHSEHTSLRITRKDQGTHVKGVPIQWLVKRGQDAFADDDPVDEREIQEGSRKDILQCKAHCISHGWGGFSVVDGVDVMFREQNREELQAHLTYLGDHVEFYVAVVWECHAGVDVGAEEACTPRRNLTVHRCQDICAKNGYGGFCMDADKTAHFRAQHASELRDILARPVGAPDGPVARPGAKFYVPQALDSGSIVIRLARKLVNWKPFDHFMLIVTIINVVALGADHHGIQDDMLVAIEGINTSCTLVFTFEILVKFLGLGVSMTFRDPYNRFDAFLVAVGIPQLIVGWATGSGGGNILSVFRLMRVARVLRLARRWERLRKIIVIVLASMVSVAYLSLLLLLILFIFSVMGMQLFGEVLELPPPTYDDCPFPDPSECPVASAKRNSFRSLWRSLLTVFVVITGESWAKVAKSTMEDAGWAAVLYFVALFVIGRYIILNLFVAIIIDRFQQERESENRRRKEKKRRKLCRATTDASARSGSPRLLRSAMSMSSRSTDSQTPRAQSQRMSPSQLGHSSVSVRTAPAEPLPAGRGGAAECSPRSPPGAVALLAAASAESPPAAKGEAPELAEAVPAPSSPRSLLKRHSLSRPGPPRRGSSPAGPAGVLSTRTPGSRTGSLGDTSPTEDSPTCRELVGADTRRRVSIHPKAVEVRRGSRRESVPGDDRRGSLFGAAERRARSVFELKLMGSSTQPTQPRVRLNLRSPSVFHHNFSALRNVDRGPGLCIVGEFLEGSPARRAVAGIDEGEWQLARINGRQVDTASEVEQVVEDLPDEELEVELVHWASLEEDESVGKERMLPEILGPVTCGPLLCWPGFAHDGCVRHYLTPIMLSRTADITVACLIALNLIVLGTECPGTTRTPEMRALYYWSDFCFTFIFTLEMLSKMVVVGIHQTAAAYLKDLWNVIDFVVVMLSILGLGIKLFTLFRAFRVFRMVTRSENVKVVLYAVIGAMPSVFNGLVVCAFAFILFSILGVQLFKGTMYECTDPTILLKANCTGNYTEYGSDVVRMREWKPGDWNFDHVGNALFTLFKLSLSEMWLYGMFAGMDSTDSETGPIRENRPYMATFYVVWFVISNFLCLNLIISILISSFQEYHEARFFQDHSKGEDSEQMSDAGSAETEAQSGLVSPTAAAAAEAAAKDPSIKEDDKAERRRVNQAKNLVGGWHSDMRKFQQMKDLKPLLTSKQRDWVRAQQLLVSDVTAYTQAPEQPVRRRCYQFVEGPYFERGIAVVIILNLLMLCTQHRGQGGTFVFVFDIINYVFIAVYTGEFGVKVTAYTFATYIADSWNRFDLAVLVISVIGLVIGESLTVFRALRILRVLRLFRMLKGLNKMFTALLYALPPLFNIGLLLCCVFFVFGVLGVSMFATLDLDLNPVLNRNANFRNLPEAVLLLFQASTAEMWIDVMDGCRVQEPDCVQPDCGTEFAILYYVLFMVCVSFLMVNLFVAVVLDAFKDADDVLSAMLESPNGEKKGTGLVDAFRNFRRMWLDRAYKLNSSGGTDVLDVDVFIELFRELEPPLGPAWKSGWSLLKDLKEFNIPVSESLEVSYQHVAHALARKAFRIQLDEAFELSSLSGVRVTDDMFTVAHVWCVRKIAAQWRRVMANKKRRAAEAERRRQEAIERGEDPDEPGSPVPPPGLLTEFTAYEVMVPGPVPRTPLASRSPTHTDQGPESDMPRANSGQIGLRRMVSGASRLGPPDTPLARFSSAGSARRIRKSRTASQMGAGPRGRLQNSCPLQLADTGSRGAAQGSCGEGSSSVRSPSSPTDAHAATT